jgi:thiamine-phosphate pyrophosphorylase
VIRVVVITDRQLCGGEALVARLAAILDAVPRGSVRVQVREKDLDGGPLRALVGDVLAIARPRGAEVWVNDRADIALVAGADGVHLPEDGLAIADARALGIRQIGVSRHSAEGALAARGADVVHLGPIWATRGKPDALGLDALGVRLGVPLVAVGGIDSPERAREARAAGADAVAVIRAAWTTADPGGLLRSIAAS